MSCHLRNELSGLECSCYYSFARFFHTQDPVQASVNSRPDIPMAGTGCLCRTARERHFPKFIIGETAEGNPRRKTSTHAERNHCFRSMIALSRDQRCDSKVSRERDCVLDAINAVASRGERIVKRRRERVYSYRASRGHGTVSGGGE